MSLEQWARPISDAARVVRATIPRHSLDLDDLVQVGWEATLRYLRGDTPVSRTLVFVAAKAAMLTAHAKWSCREWTLNASGNRVRGGPAPKLTEYQEWFRAEPPPPIELLIDAYRALLRLRREEREAWVATRWNEEPVRSVADRFSCQPHTVIARARRADQMLTARVGGEARVREGRTAVRSAKRDKFRARYRELRALGVPSGKAVRAAHGSQHAYATALRQVAS